MTIEVQTPGPRLCLTAGPRLQGPDLHNGQAAAEKQIFRKSLGAYLRSPVTYILGSCP